MKTFILFLLVNLTMFSQETDRCAKTFYKGQLRSVYKIYEINKVDFDTISISKKDLLCIVETLKSKGILSEMKSIISNSLFIEMVEAYSLTSDNDQYSLESYANEFKGQKNYNDFLISKNKIDSVTKKILKENLKILNISIYTNLSDLGDCYFYQIGHNNFNFRRVSNSIITSVLYGKNYEKDKNKYIGIETTDTGQIITYPIVSKGIYICDLKLMLCI